MDIHAYLIDACTIAATVLLFLAKIEVNRWLAKEGGDKDQAFLDNVLDHAAQVGINLAQTRLNKPITVDLHSEAVNDGVKAALQLAEKEKSSLGYNDDDLAKMILARLDLSGPTVKVAGRPEPPLIAVSPAHS